MGGRGRKREPRRRKTVEEGKSLLPIPSVKRRRSQEFLDLKGKFEKNENPENCDKTTSTLHFLKGQ